MALGTTVFTLLRVKSLLGAWLFAEEAILEDLWPGCLEAR